MVIERVRETRGEEMRLVSESCVSLVDVCAVKKHLDEEKKKGGKIITTIELSSIQSSKPSLLYSIIIIINRVLIRF